jgi:hypothetical protein
MTHQITRLPIIDKIKRLRDVGATPLRFFFFDFCHLVDSFTSKITNPFDLFRRRDDKSLQWHCADKAACILNIPNIDKNRSTASHLAVPAKPPSWRLGLHETGLAIPTSFRMN